MDLTELPPELRFVTNLATLWIGCNKLCSLPSDILLLTMLESLYAQDCELQSLPNELGRLTNLQHFLVRRVIRVGWDRDLTGGGTHAHAQVRDNYLTALPASLGQCTKLRTLSVRRVMCLLGVADWTCLLRSTATNCWPFPPRSAG
jgi:hypothetical protein